jgi:hypothetical protein
MQVHVRLHPERVTTVMHFSKLVGDRIEQALKRPTSMVFSNFTAITTLRPHLFNRHLYSSRRLSFGVGSLPISSLDLMLRPRLILALETALPQKTDACTRRSHSGLCTNTLLDSWHVPHRVSFGVPGNRLLSYLRRLSIKSTLIAGCDPHDMDSFSSSICEAAAVACH